MAKKIVIPLEKGIQKSVPIKFPSKCVTCGAPKTDTLPEIIHRKYQIGVTENKPVFQEYDLDPIDIPYCNQHYKSIKKVDEDGKRLFGYIMYPSFIIVGVLNFVFFYMPTYNMARDHFNIVLSFLATVIWILVLTLIVGVIFLYLIGTVIYKILNPPIGLKTEGQKDLLFTFKNEMIANDFLTLNQDLGAHWYSFQKAFKEGWDESKEMTKK